MVKKCFTDYLLMLFLSFIGILTLFNYSGHTPIPLVISIVLCSFLFFNLMLLGRIKYKVVPEDLLLIFFLLVSALSVLLNFNRYQLNLNHLFSEFAVIFFYYFTIKLAFSNSKYFQSRNNFYGVILLGTLIVFLCGLADFFLLISGTNITDILPMSQANVSAHVGAWFPRARSFLPEPTDYALCLNALFPIIIFNAIENGNTKKIFFLSVLYFFALMTTISTSGIVSLLLALSIAFIYGVLKNEVKLRSLLKYIVCYGLCFMIIFYIFQNELMEIFSTIIFKLTLSEESRSWISRLVAYERGIENLRMTLLSVLIGIGTGFFSGLGEGSTHSWWLTILVEKGLAGVAIMTFLIWFIYLRISRIKSKVKYGLLISLVSMIIHYTTQTGFYFPFFWFLMVCVQHEYHMQLSKTPRHSSP